LPGGARESPGGPRCDCQDGAWSLHFHLTNFPIRLWGRFGCPSPRGRKGLAMLRRRVPLIAAAAALTLGGFGLWAVNASAQTNLVANPGFESSLANWTCAPTDSVTTSAPHGGT